MKIFIAIPTYNRAQVLSLCIKFFLSSKLINGFIVVAQATTSKEAEKYANVLKELRDSGFEVLHQITNTRLGSVGARNRLIEIAVATLAKSDIFIMYDDDFVYPGDYTIKSILGWLNFSSVGMVGGRVINLRRRRIDPDFALNIDNLADKLTEISGFILLNTIHGPRVANYTSHPFAFRVETLQKGIRYDENYQGTGYREESDLQRQIKAIGLKIIYEPRFFAYHLAVETGGNRYSDLQDRIYWKWKNHTYFMNKWHYPTSKKILSYVILTTYALLNGPPAIRGIMKAVKNR
jgi:GT2 family glycosyltransferase